MPHTRPKPSSVKHISEQLLDAIKRGSDFMVIATDKKGTVTFFNAAAEKLIGYSADEILGKQTPEFWHDAEEIRQLAVRLSEENHREITPGFEVFITKSTTDEWVSREWTFIRKDGSRFPVLLSVEEQKNIHGFTVGYIGIAKDITTRRELEARSTSRGILLDCIIRNISDGLVTLDNRGIIQSCNPPCETLFGYEEHEMVGQNVSMLMPELHQAQHDGYLENVLLSEKNNVIDVSREVYGQRKNGDTFPIELSMKRFRINENIFYNGIIRDVSVRKSESEEREKLIDELTRSNNEFEYFAHVASHDMQEPLRTLCSFSDIILFEYEDKLDEEGKTYLSMISSAARRMQTMVVDMLDYAQMGKTINRFESFGANEQYSNAMENLATSIAECKGNVVCDYLPQLRGDALQFMRVLQNLIGNGLKFHPPAAPPDVRVSVENKDDTWLFSVSDNGLGISEKKLTSIFTPFKRLNNRPEYPGTGLGLSVCARIIKNHSGEIWCRSSPGNGSTFLFTWPK